MPYAVLGLGFVLLLLGSFAITGAIFDKSRSTEARVGRMIRGFIGESLGIMCIVIAWTAGTKNQFTLGSVIISIAVGGTAAVFHTMMSNRKFGRPDSEEQS